ncbi:hypothetical protein HU675_0035170 [Bradyrhizobium septentrionale]|uniref:hypothetical protein n=1 Tax=Bradyrhizobium septentrionale TaxID=1404411 RepID=UPI0015964DCF|nr:hypothetical protein [Bradyrhizobium septentrionale]UGY23159.1 hypothetical protein HU675_0035170 [Bradyrhizobium septentrionale]
MNQIQFAYDAAAMQGVFNNAAMALAIVAVVLLALSAVEFRCASRSSLPSGRRLFARRSSSSS